MSHIEQTLQKIESVNLKNDEAISELEHIISTELKKLPIFITDMIPGEYIVRSRLLKPEESFHTAIQDFSYHPQPSAILIGRANYAGQQIFYASRYRVTSLGELRFIYANRLKMESFYSIGRWDVKKKLGLAAIITPELIRQHNTKELFSLAQFIQETENEYINDLNMKGFIDIYRYMASKYTETVQEGEEYKYKITAAFSNYIYTKLPLTDGILYQSVQYPENFNVALKKDVIDDGKVQLSFAARQRYLQIGQLHFQEQESIETRDINYNSNKIKWP